MLEVMTKTEIQISSKKYIKENIGIGKFLD